MRGGDTPYGWRDFVVLDGDGNLITFFGLTAGQEFWEACVSGAFPHLSNAAIAFFVAELRHRRSSSRKAMSNGRRGSRERTMSRSA